MSDPVRYSTFLELAFAVAAPHPRLWVPVSALHLKYGYNVNDPAPEMFVLIGACAPRFWEDNLAQARKFPIRESYAYMAHYDYPSQACTLCKTRHAAEFRHCSTRYIPRR